MVGRVAGNAVAPQRVADKEPLLAAWLVQTPLPRDTSRATTVAGLGLPLWQLDKSLGRGAGSGAARFRR